MTQDKIKEIVDYINHTETQKLKAKEFRKWLFYNGSTKPVIEEAIKKEFKNSDTINELMNRLIPLNILKKIIDKLAQTYVETPVRYTRDTQDYNSDILEGLETATNINIVMKKANRYFKLFKKCLVEMFITEDGVPSLRVLPPHTYYTFSSSLITPESCDVVVKILEQSNDPSAQKLLVWTKDEMFLMTGAGKIINSFEYDESTLPNTSLEDIAVVPQMTNPYGILPFAYISESDLSTEPVPDDDLFSASVAIPIILTDLCFGIKYQSWSLIYTIGFTGDLPSSPNSVVHMDKAPDGTNPEIGQLKPQLDSDAILRLIEAIISYLLTTRGLKSDTISGTLTVGNAASGVSKAIDSADLIEDKKDQQNYFLNLESQVWNKLINTLLPYWKSQNLLRKDLNQEFIGESTVAVTFKEPQTVISEKEKIEIAKLKIDSGLSTIRRELFNIYPDFTEDDVKQLLIEIEDDKAKKLELFVNTNNTEDNKEDETSDQDVEEDKNEM